MRNNTAKLKFRVHTFLLMAASPTTLKKLWTPNDPWNNILNSARLWTSLWQPKISMMQSALIPPKLLHVRYCGFEQNLSFFLSAWTSTNTGWSNTAFWISVVTKLYTFLICITCFQCFHLRGSLQVFFPRL